MVGLFSPKSESHTYNDPGNKREWKLTVFEDTIDQTKKSMHPCIVSIYSAKY